MIAKTRSWSDEEDDEVVFVYSLMIICDNSTCFLDDYLYKIYIFKMLLAHSIIVFFYYSISYHMFSNKPIFF